MLAFTGITAVAMIFLGWVMAGRANQFLGSQKQHDGIEVAKLAAQLANGMAERMNEVSAMDPTTNLNLIKYRTSLQRQLEDVRTWSTDIVDASDILAVKLNCPDRLSGLSSAGVGSDESASADRGQRFERVFIPKSGATVTLPDTIQVFQAIRRAEGGETLIYRFKVMLDRKLYGGREPQGTDWSKTPYVNLDINATSVSNAQSHLVMAILIGVSIAIAAVIGIASWLAATITRPVHLLVDDMKIVAKGDLSHETVPRSSDEIGVLAQEFNRMTENLNQAQSALVEQEKAEYELSIAREVQRQLLPAKPPEIPGFQCGSYYLGAKAVSGDYFDFIDLGNGQWGFIIADVSGKGIPGSMVMAVTRTIVRLIASKNGARADETLKETNRLIAHQIKRGMFVTSFYAVLDTGTGLLSYACAGHNPMVIYRAATKTRELASGKGIALGFNEGPIFDRTIELHRTNLQSGDTIVLYTDGFPEAMSAANEEFGDDKFYDLVPRYAGGDVQLLINGLVEEIAAHRGEAEQSDDLTLVTVRRM